VPPRLSWVALFAVACVHHLPRVPELEASALFVPGRYDYVELESHLGLPPVSNVVTETWTRAPDQVAPDEAPGEVWVVDNYGLPPLPPGTEAMANKPVLLGRTSYSMGPKGLVHYSFERGNDVRTYAPKVSLPPRVGPRVTWTGTHGSGMDQNTQNCAVEPTPYCADGAAIACETRWLDRAVWMRHHWCVGVGWVGYEAVRVANGATTTSWSEEVTRDGQPLPTVEVARRPMPEVVIHRAEGGAE
jgi:hypothetical protein